MITRARISIVYKAITYICYGFFLSLSTNAQLSTYEEIEELKSLGKIPIEKSFHVLDMSEREPRIEHQIYHPNHPKHAQTPYESVTFPSQMVINGMVDVLLHMKEGAPRNTGANKNSDYPENPWSVRVSYDWLIKALNRNTIRSLNEINDTLKNIGSPLVSSSDCFQPGLSHVSSQAQEIQSTENEINSTIEDGAIASVQSEKDLSDFNEESSSRIIVDSLGDIPKEEQQQIVESAQRRSHSGSSRVNLPKLGQKILSIILSPLSNSKEFNNQHSRVVDEPSRATAANSLSPIVLPETRQTVDVSDFDFPDNYDTIKCVEGENDYFQNKVLQSFAIQPPSELGSLKDQNFELCVAEALNRQNFTASHHYPESGTGKGGHRSCDNPDSPWINQTKRRARPCTESWPELISREVLLTAKCFNLDPYEYFAMINHESSFYLNITAASGSQWGGAGIGMITGSAIYGINALINENLQNVSSEFDFDLGNPHCHQMAKDIFLDNPLIKEKPDRTSSGDTPYCYRFEPQGGIPIPRRNLFYSIALYKNLRVKAKEYYQDYLTDSSLNLSKDPVFVDHVIKSIARALYNGGEPDTMPILMDQFLDYLKTISLHGPNDPINNHIEDFNRALQHILHKHKGSTGLNRETPNFNDNIDSDLRRLHLHIKDKYPTGNISCGS